MERCIGANGVVKEIVRRCVGRVRPYPAESMGGGVAVAAVDPRSDRAWNCQLQVSGGGAK